MIIRPSYLTCPYGATFVESNEVTSVELVGRHLSKELRDASAESGVAEGSEMGFDGLEKILDDMQAA